MRPVSRLLAGVRRRRQGGRRGSPHDEPHRRPGRVDRAPRARGAWPTGTGARRCWPPRRRGGSRDGLGLPRRDPGLPHRRGRPPDHRETIGAWFAQRGGRPARRRLLHRAARVRGPRVSLVIPPPPVDLGGACHPPRSLRRTFSNPPLDATYPAHAWWRRAEIPAANGHGNARSVALVQSIIAGGGEARGVRLLSEKGCDAIFDEQSNRRTSSSGCPSGSAWATG